ncbi:MAG: FKBP-type peptidyl-prolyl cis-trans isomerase FklB [Halieaceae bacterium]|jgi:FKBP-type peptidyl-prolyl cis-trans isomerase FklB
MPDIDLSTDELKASYGVGLQMGEQLRSVFKSVSLAAGVAGLKDGFNSQEPQLGPDAINAAFQVIQGSLRAEEKEKAAQFAQEGEDFLMENAKREEITVTESGLQYEILEAGGGEMPLASSTVRTHYRGTLINGEEFDSSYGRGEPTEFPVNGVISGWTEALQLMPVGGKWKLYIPYQLAYGEQGAGGAIGPYQALIFELELIAIL